MPEAGLPAPHHWPRDLICDCPAVPGGFANEANGNDSFAAGYRAKANHGGTFVWGDSTFEDFTSTGPNQFLIRAGGGVGIGTSDPQARLDVEETGDGENDVFRVTRNAQSSGDAQTVSFRLDPTNDVFQLDVGGNGNVAARIHLGDSDDPDNHVTTLGNVGIGTTTPEAKLHLLSEAGAADAGGLWVSRVGAAATGRFFVDDNDVLNIRRGAGDARVLSLDGTGNVGIGTTNPIRRLHVEETGNGENTVARLARNAQSSGDSQVVEFRLDPTNDVFSLDVGGNGNSSARIHLGDSDNPDNDVTTLGDVGIGTTNPFNRLHVKETGDGENIVARFARDAQSSSDSQAVTFWLDPTNHVFKLDVGGTGNGSARIHLGDSSSPDNQVTTLGNVGIGTTFADAKLHIRGGSDVNGVSGGYILLGNLLTANLGIDDNEIMARTNGAPADLFLQNDGGDLLIGANGDGYVGIKESAPQAPLHVGGAARFDGPVTIPTTTRFLNVGAAAFQPNTNTVLAGGRDLPNLAWNRLSISNNCTATAPVSLPHGARITGLRINVRDDSFQENIEVLLKHHGTSDLASEIASVESASAASSRRTFSTSVNHTVNAKDSVYFLYVRWTDLPQESISFTAARITYTVDQPLP